MLVLAADEDAHISAGREPLHEVAQVDAVLEHVEDAAEPLGALELGLLHDVEQALAEDLLDRRGVELVHDPGDTFDRQREQGVDRRGAFAQRVEHGIHLGGRLGAQHPVDAAGDLVEFGPGVLAVEVEQHLLDRALGHDQQQAGRPFGGGHDVDATDAAGARLDGRGDGS